MTAVMPFLIAGRGGESLMEQKGKAIAAALGAFFAMAFVQNLCLTLLGGLWTPEQAEAGRTLVLGLSAAIILALLLLADRFSHEPLLRQVPGTAPHPLILTESAILGAAANCALSAGLSLAAFSEQLLAEYAQAIPMGKGAALGLELTAYCLLIPVMEEALFRGFILNVLRRAFPLAAAVGLECLIFAWGHGQALWFVYALAMGLALTLLRLKTGGLCAPIAFHIAFNAANYLQPQLYSAVGESRKGLVILLAGGLIVCACMILLLFSGRKKKE